jgi:hypothetical protein
MKQLHSTPRLKNWLAWYQTEFGEIAQDWFAEVPQLRLS